MAIEYNTYEQVRDKGNKCRVTGVRYLDSNGQTVAADHPKMMRVKIYFDDGNLMNMHKTEFKRMMREHT